MLKQIQRAWWPIVIGTAVAMNGASMLAQAPIEYKHEGNTFRIQPVPDRESCFKMTRNDVEGYIGVWANGTAERPYG